MKYLGVDLHTFLGFVENLYLRVKCVMIRTSPSLFKW